MAKRSPDVVDMEVDARGNKMSCVTQYPCGVCPSEYTGSHPWTLINNVYYCKKCNEARIAEDATVAMHAEDANGDVAMGSD